MRRAAGHGATEGTKCPGYTKKGLRKGGNKRGFRDLLGRFGNYLGKMQLGCKQV